jgi:hypothetical protein
MRSTLLAIPSLLLLLCSPGLAETYTAKSFQLQAPASIGCDPDGPNTLAAAETAADSRAWPERYRELVRAVRDHHRPVPIEAKPSAGMALDAPQAVVKPPEVTPGSEQQSRISLDRQPVGPSAGRSSTVGEPSVAVRGDDVLFTGNWYAAMSHNGGQTFRHIDPAQAFGLSSNNQAFCCDQVAISHGDSLFWLLQYRRADLQGNSKENTLRLAVSTGDEIQKQCWHYYDLVPSRVGAWTNEWFDFPDLALSDNHIYVATNVFSTICTPIGNPNCDYRFTRSTLIRLPLRGLKEAKSAVPLAAQYFALDQNPQNTGTLRPTQGARGTMYWGTHKTQGLQNQIRVHAWPEQSSTIESFDVPVDQWTRGVPVAPHSTGRDWIGRSDPRITAAWTNETQVGFAWTVPQDINYTYPQVRVAIVDVQSKKIIAQPHLWNSKFAYAYPAAAPNGRGEIGFSLFFGGEDAFPSHAVGILASGGGNSWAWRVRTSNAGEFTVDLDGENRWGDYLAVRPHPSGDGSWVASGYTLEAGSSADKIRADYVRFRSRDEQPMASAAQPDVTRELTENAARLVAIWRQQPNNVTALQSTLARVGQNLETLRGDGKAKEAAGTQLPPSPQLMSTLETHRPAGPAEQRTAAAADVVSEVDTIQSKSAELRELLSRPARDREAEARAIDAVAKLLAAGRQ